MLVAHASYAVIFMSESSIAKIQWSYLYSSTVLDGQKKKEGSVADRNVWGEQTMCGVWWFVDTM